MSDLKSKLPDLEEITSMASKLFNDVSSSIGEIVDSYKKKREVSNVPEVKPEKTDEALVCKKKDDEAK